jgi:ribose/xylose/arabinose/galactoside ABC-type transport system permease subunit
VLFSVIAAAYVGVFFSDRTVHLIRQDLGRSGLSDNRRGLPLVSGAIDLSQAMAAPWRADRLVRHRWWHLPWFVACFWALSPGLSGSSTPRLSSVLNLAPVIATMAMASIMKPL